jgi:hypothetical protein
MSISKLFSTTGACALCVATLALAGCGGSSKGAPRSKGSAGPAVAANSGERAPAGGGGSASSAPGRGAHPAAHHAGRRRSSASVVPIAPARRSGRRSSSRVGTSGTGPIPGCLGGSCGASGGSGGASAGGGSSRAKYTPFMAAADAICRSYRKQVQPLNHPNGFAAVEEVEPELVRAADLALARLGALTPPRAEAAKFKVFTNMTAASVQETETATSRSKSTSEAVGGAQDWADFAAFGQAIQDADSAGAAARAIGLRVCGSPGSDWF